MRYGIPVGPIQQTFITVFTYGAYIICSSLISLDVTALISLCHIFCDSLLFPDSFFADELLFIALSIRVSLILLLLMVSLKPSFNSSISGGPKRSLYSLEEVIL